MQDIYSLAMQMQDYSLAPADAYCCSAQHDGVHPGLCLHFPQPFGRFFSHSLRKAGVPLVLHYRFPRGRPEDSVQGGPLLPAGLFQMPTGLLQTPQAGLLPIPADFFLMGLLAGACGFLMTGPI